MNGTKGSWGRLEREILLSNDAGALNSVKLALKQLKNEVGVSCVVVVLYACVV
jgi:hypothetical protein